MMLENFNYSQLKNMNLSELEQLCTELREKIITTVMKNGGHLSSNLGVIELTVALHYVFDFPYDKLVFDVGHQSYAHKLLTGRYEQFDSIRTTHGISGFPKREESVFDCYNVGHAGTSISAALGMAKARDIKGEHNQVIALIGDGSFNNGLIYEAFNCIKELKSNILVILNDNGMSISPTVGSMHDYLESLNETPEHVEKKVKHANIFERFGFQYEGVYNGNNLSEMITQLQRIKVELQEHPVILHCLTVKGKGYSFCEENPMETHGVSASQNKTIEYSQILGETLEHLADTNENIVAVTAAMTPSLGLSNFFKKYPERSIDVGICEEHATILCASMAAAGLKPYYAVYSTFLQRSYDEIIIDICSQNLPVTLCIDRAGISGADGETHQGVFDLSMMSMIPNLTIAVPKDSEEFKDMLEFSVDYNYPLAIRYPRESKNFFGSHNKIQSTEWEILEPIQDITILACGERAITIATQVIAQLKQKSISIGLVNARFVKPLDTALLSQLKHQVITIEDNMLNGGFGSLINNYFSNKDIKVKNFAYCDSFIEHGSINYLMEEYGVSVNSIVEYILSHEIR